MRARGSTRSNLFKVIGQVMSDPSALIPIATAAAAGGTALGITIAAARRFLPLASLVVNDAKRGPERRTPTGSAPGSKRWGTARKSEIIGLGESGTIRYTD